MSVSTHINGILENNEKHKKIIKVLEALSSLGIEDLPKEIEEYYKGSDLNGCDINYILEQSREGFVVSIDSEDYTEDGESGFIVDVDKIPKNVKKLKVYQSW